MCLCAPLNPLVAVGVAPARELQVGVMRQALRNNFVEDPGSTCPTRFASSFVSAESRMQRGRDLCFAQCFAQRVLLIEILQLRECAVSFKTELGIDGFRKLLHRIL